MRDLLIIVEGECEEHFVKNVLSPYLKQQLGRVISVKPELLGGGVCYKRIKQLIDKNYSEYHLITSFIDLVKLGSAKIINKADYNKIMAMHISSAEKCDRICDNWINKLHSESYFQKFIPYIQPYEFEALLLADCKMLCSQLPINYDKLLKQISKTNNNIQYPETINNKNTPAKILETCNYEKSAAIIIMQHCDIDVIIKKCPYFATWVNKILQKLRRIHEQK